MSAAARAVRAAAGRPRVRRACTATWCRCTSSSCARATAAAGSTPRSPTREPSTSPTRRSTPCCCSARCTTCADRADRVRALAEARRVGRPGALVVAAVISRWAPRLHGVLTQRLYREHPHIRDLLGRRRGRRAAAAAVPGVVHRQHAPPGRPARRGGDAGLVVEDLVGVEGLAFALPDLGERLADPVDREVVLDSGARRAAGARAARSVPAPPRRRPGSLTRSHPGEQGLEVVGDRAGVDERGEVPAGPVVGPRAPASRAARPAGRAPSYAGDRRSSRTARPASPAPAAAARRRSPRPAAAATRPARPGRLVRDQLAQVVVGPVREGPAGCEHAGRARRPAPGGLGAQQVQPAGRPRRRQRRRPGTRTRDAAPGPRAGRRRAAAAGSPPRSGRPAAPVRSAACRAHLQRGAGDEPRRRTAARRRRRRPRPPTWCPRPRSTVRAARPRPPRR